MSEDFIRALQADWRSGGIEALRKVREKEPSQYCRIIASLVPKEITGEDGGPLVSELTVVFVEDATRELEPQFVG